MPDNVQSQSTQFAQRLEDLLTATVQTDDPAYVFTDAPCGSYRRGGRTAYIIKQRDEGGIPLSSGGKVVLKLQYNFQCSCRDEGAWLQVDKSSIMLMCAPDYAPLMHYDYFRADTHNIPAAHINIHGSNDSATRLMLSCGSGTRGKNRRKKFVNEGIFPTFSALHFPVGGERLRPGIEDVLQMAAYEFDIDMKDGWLDAINNSRAEYRRRQVAALVREFPDIAYETLRNEGYDLQSTPPRPARDNGKSNLTRY